MNKRRNWLLYLGCAWILENNEFSNCLATFESRTQGKDGIPKSWRVAETDIVMLAESSSPGIGAVLQPFSNRGKVLQPPVGSFDLRNHLLQTMPQSCFFGQLFLSGIVWIGIGIGQWKKQSNLACLSVEQCLNTSRTRPVCGFIYSQGWDYPPAYYKPLPKLYLHNRPRPRAQGRTTVQMFATSGKNVYTGWIKLVGPVLICDLAVFSRSLNLSQYHWF